MRTRMFTLIAGIACALSYSPVHAHEGGMQISGNGAETKASASGHGPIGVMGDHMHHKGEWMLAYRYMYMEMDGNRKGMDDISPETIVTTEPNRFFGMPGQPATLRVVPTHMEMDMHMFGAMYAPTDGLTLTAMLPYVEKEMKSVTYSGAAGTTVLGTNKSSNNGWGDAKVSGIFRLYDDAVNHAHFNIGLSLPTGSLDETGTMLTPANVRMRMRMPYGMQLGKGTYNLLPGLTYTGHKGAWSWGTQYHAEISLQDENDEGYAWGDKHNVMAWAAHEWAQWISTSVRLNGTSQGKIDGIDPNIMAPVQSADPDNYGGRSIDLGLGVNLIGIKGPLTDHRLAVEVTTPLYQDLNGPQLEKDWAVTIGWQYAF